MMPGVLRVTGRDLHEHELYFRHSCSLWLVMYTGSPQAAYANWTMVAGLSCIVSLVMAEMAASLPATDKDIIPSQKNSLRSKALLFCSVSKVAS